MPATADAQRHNQYRAALQQARATDIQPSARQPSYVVAAQQPVRPMRTPLLKKGADAQGHARRRLLRARAQSMMPRHQSKKQKERIAKAHKAIRAYEKAPFIFAYALAAGSFLLGTIDLVAVGLLGYLEKYLKFVSLFGIIGKAVSGGITILGLTLVLTIGFLVFLIQMPITLYLIYFYWRHSSFMRKFLTKRLRHLVMFFVALIPIINLFPWSIVRLFLLNMVLKKRAERAKKYLKKNT